MPIGLALRWVVWLEVVGTAVVVPLIALASPALAIGVAQVAGALGLLALVTVIRRQNLLGVEKLFERTLRFVLLAGALTLVYAGVIAAGSELIGSGARPLAAAAVALSVLPLRDGLARVVARFVYGDRANAADIVRGVAGRAEHAGSPNEMLERFLEDLVVGTGCGGASVQLADNGIIASVGETDGAGSTLIPLRHRGAVVGELRMSPSAGELCLDGLADRVARDVAPHLALVADACRADLALEQARERLVRGREEERRRLRRDLHDGLGPILTGVAFSADAASNLVETDPNQAIELIVAARRDVTDALGEIRRIVEDLRPPALDELGLEGAIRQHAQRLPQLEVTVSGSILAVDLPAAVEVAAYRIATEALTNVARHANATKANVDVTLNGHLAVAISDDGQRQESWIEGVGLGSMRDRARELGGVLTAGPFAGGGRVVANLPVESR